MSETHRILIVEDEAIVAMALRGRLENLGYDAVGVVDSGEEAIEQAGELRPDLVLMDIRLSGAMDGIEAAEQIRVRYDIPVVYLTAHADQATLDRAKLTGPYGYLLKPVQERALNSAVEVSLYRHRMEKRLRDEAHAVKNSIGIMQSFAELLKHELEGSLRNDALTIFDEAQRAGKVLHDLLRFARLPESSKEEVDVTEIQQKALTLKDPAFRINHIELQLDLAADIPRVMADKDQLLQVFINILTNAEQAMSEANKGGNLRIQGRRVDKKLRLTFVDDGPGIPEDILQKIFDPLFTTKAVG